MQSYLRQQTSSGKHPYIKCPGYPDRKDDHRNNHPKKLGYEKPKSNSKVLCPIHSFPDKPAKHSSADCSKNPANQKKPAPQSGVNTHHAAINNCYLSNDHRSQMDVDHTEAADNQNLDHRSLSTYNNSFVTFKAPPPPAHKKVAEKVERGNKLVKNKRRATASSNNDGKDTAYAQSVSALAKGLKEPLAFSLESDWWYVPVDGTSSLGNSLNV